jgi:cation:H+ antiporter
MTAILLLLAGFVLLLAGAEFLVRGASHLARAFAIPPLVIGLTVVAFGTSAPELAMSLQAALDNRADIALGNVVGSNIFNVLFILGLSALITPLFVSRNLVRLEVAISLLDRLHGPDPRSSHSPPQPAEDPRV